MCGGRVTLRAQETFWLIHLAIEELKGPAGLDESGVSLFKTPGIKNLKQNSYYNIDMDSLVYKVNLTHCMYVCVFTAASNEMCAGQQRHLECIQDPPDMCIYRVARTTTINNVDVPYYKCLRGSNSLEGFHNTLPHIAGMSRL